LKFNGICASLSNSVDIGMRRSQAAIMCLGNFSNNETRLSGEHFTFFQEMLLIFLC
jgi:hypothetical protein